MNNLGKSSILILALTTVVSCSKSSFTPQSVSKESQTQSTEASAEISESEGQPDLGLEKVFEDVSTTSRYFEEEASPSALASYNHLDPQRLIRTSALKTALAFFDKNQKLIKNKNYITLIDFSKSSSQRRMYVVNMKTGSVWALHTAHGSGSDKNNDGYAERFSNVSGSNASSLGYYLTAETYYGKNGYSLRLDGLSSTNSKARSRAVVVHGASYVQDKTRIQGRSWGCPAVASDYNNTLINIIKSGSLIYAFN